ncbi:MAG: MGMT family protein [Chitinophagaceae bacterium]|nr:MGMT family protein [Chitinophagaceae bacterium]
MSKKLPKDVKPATGTSSQQQFFKDVWDVVMQVPRGRVTTYGAIAAYLGSKMSARMVGWAMNAAHTQHHVPAQRVVNRMGMLSGKAHFGTPTRMQELLEADGVTVKDDRVLNFTTLFWDPAKELEL